MPRMPRSFKRLSSASETLVSTTAAAGSRSNLRQGVKGDAIIGPIGRGRHDDISRRTEAMLQQLVIGD
jgi:hypothetical protein